MLSPLLSNTLPISQIHTSQDTTVIKLAGPADACCEMTIQRVASHIPAHIRRVRIEGDEPLMHGDQLGVLLSELSFEGKTIHLRTSGILEPPAYWKDNTHICWSFGL